MTTAYDVLVERGRINVDYYGPDSKYMAVRIRVWVKNVVDADKLAQAYGGSVARRMNGCLWTACNKDAVSAAARDMHRYGGRRMQTLANLLAEYAQSKRGHTTRASRRVMRILQCRSAALTAVTAADSNDVRLSDPSI